MEKGERENEFPLVPTDAPPHRKKEKTPGCWFGPYSAAV